MTELTDTQRIDSAIGTLARFGFNADRNNFDMVLTLALEYAKEGSERLEVIRSITDLTQHHGKEIRAFLAAEENQIRQLSGDQ